MQQRTSTCSCRVSKSPTTGIYFLTARQNGKTSSVKMVNNGNGTGYGIEYAGTIVETHGRASLQSQPKNGTKGVINHSFTYGDAMTYKGFAFVDGEEIEGAIISQTQSQSEDITLLVFSPNPNDGQPCSDALTLTDVDGNTYNTVQIGGQCWMKENLRTTRYTDNTPIALRTYLDIDACRYEPDDNSIYVPVYGYLYNWTAVTRDSSSSSNPSGVQGICPDGWHVPSDAEWTQLGAYVKSQPAYVCEDCTAPDEEMVTSCIVKALASQTGWHGYIDDCSIDHAQSNSNATGFSAYPAGGYYGNYVPLGIYASFWSTTQTGGQIALSCGMDYDDIYYSLSNTYMEIGYSVRCLRD